MLPKCLRSLLMGSSSSRIAPARGHRLPRYRPKVELLEARNLLAIFTWTGAGADSNWSTPANWDANAVPGVSDSVAFNASGTKDAIVDAAFAGTVASLDSRWSHTLTLARSLTV